MSGGIFLASASGRGGAAVVSGGYSSGRCDVTPWWWRGAGVSGGSERASAVEIEH